MGLFSGFKKQLLKVIQWEDSSNDTIVYRYPMPDKAEIMTSSTLIVRESQCAIFMHKGQIADVFGPGTYTLSTENIPFLTKLLSLPTGFESRIKAEVYFVNTKQFIGQKWGTQNPITLRDEEFGTVRIRGFGVYAFRVTDAAKFMRQVFGTNAIYKVDAVNEQIKPLLIQGITDTFAESKISVLDFAANLEEFANEVVVSSKNHFDEIGITITQFVIENVSLPEAVSEAIDQRASLGVLGDKMGAYTQKKAADAMGDAAKAGGTNLAGLGVGFGAGGAIGGLFANSINASTQNANATELVICPKCGAKVAKNAKFCPECGCKMVQEKVKCPKCGETVNKSAKFCPECGEKLLKEKVVCPKCKAEVDAGKKFCPECGEKLN